MSKPFSFILQFQLKEPSIIKYAVQSFNYFHLSEPIYIFSTSFFNWNINELSNILEVFYVEAGSKTNTGNTLIIQNSTVSAFSNCQSSVPPIRSSSLTVYLPQSQVFLQNPKSNFLSKIYRFST